MSGTSTTEKMAIAAAGAAAGALVAWRLLLRPYVPDKVWKPPTGGSGGKWAKINSHTAGKGHQLYETKALPVGAHDLQLYSLGTPNGVKVTILLEELCAADPAFEYDAWLTMIDGAQFTSGFVDVNPNSKIPALYDQSTKTRVFESGSILVYLCEKYDKTGNFLPTSGPKRTEVLNWLFWQMSTGGYLGGGFGHFYAYAPSKMQYPLDRFTMEAKRQLSVLDAQLATRPFLAGDAYTIADVACYPWYGKIVDGSLYGAKEFLDCDAYPNVKRWAAAVAARPAVKRGNKVNRTWGKPCDQLHNRHSRADFDAPPAGDA
jgi:GST-like protein